MTLRVSNADAKRLWLDSQGLAATPTGPLDLLGIIKHLGFVQLDTIRVVARAHDHILWSRNQHYREPMLNKLLAKERAVFEHFTHDASILPAEFYPLWRRQFRRMAAKARRHHPKLDMADCASIKERIASEGPLSTHAFESQRPAKSAFWARPSHKVALDYLWYAGELSTSHRKNFIKYYDLSERVISDHLRADERSEDEQIDWLCRAALSRLDFGSEGDLQRFWEAASLAEVKDWVRRRRAELLDIRVETAAGDWLPALAPPEIEQRLANAPAPTSRLRILNPFDPAIRDRTRLCRLFGFDYRVEMFVPAAQRKWGYYVFPLLEGYRFVGRLEARADRRAGRLTLDNLWPEPGVRWTARRQEKLEAELERLGRLVGIREIVQTKAATPP